MKWIYALCFLCVLLLCGCVSYAPAVGSMDAPVAGGAYLYGRFNMARAGNLLQTGLVVASSDSRKEYIFRFMKTGDVYAVKVEPGSYSIDSLVFAAAGGEKQGKKSIRHLIIDNHFQLEEGHAYYLGDFFSSASTAVTHVSLAMVIGEYSWSVNSVVNDFEKTTKEFNSRYPRFNNIPKKPVFKGAILKQ